MAAGTPDLDDIYFVLRGWALAKQYKTYTDLSQQYRVRTGDWFEPHLSWDRPLGALNDRLYAATRAPALSALVVLKATGEPGGAFWECAPNVPPRPPTDVERLAEWARIVAGVHAYDWPSMLP
jgi:hypothetical protein